MKLSLLSLAVLSTTAFAQTNAPVNQHDEAKCKELLKKELVKKGIINKHVCLDDSNYPNISISMDNYKHDPGDETKSLNQMEIKSMKILSDLLTNSTSQLEGSKMDIEGYSDGIPYLQTKYDSVLGLESCGNGKKKVTNKTLKYIDGIKDPSTISVLKDLQLGQCLNSTKANFSEQLDVIRNHYLARKRADDFCNQLNISGNDCSSNSVGKPSPELIRFAHNKDIKTILDADYEGRCDERRGIKYNFYFPDEVKKEKIVNHGYFEPEYDISGRNFQNKMQFSAALDFMRQIKENTDSFPELKKLEDLEGLTKSKYFSNVDADKERFQKLLAGTGCENNQYQIDNQRRKYWAIQKQLLDTEKAMANSNSSDKEFINAVKDGDYSKLMQYKNIVKLSSINGIPLDQNYIGELRRARSINLEKERAKVQNMIKQKEQRAREYRMQGDETNAQEVEYSINRIKETSELNLSALKKIQDGMRGIPENELNKLLNNPAKVEMIKLSRTLLIGAPVYDGNNKNFAHKQAFTEGYVNKEYKDNNKLKLNLKKNPELKKYVNRGTYFRYPDSPMGTGVNAYPATDIHACNSISDAMAEYIDHTANPNILKSNLKVGDDVQLGVINLDEVELNNRVRQGFVKGSLDPYFSKFNSPGNMKSKGWICKGCGSGIHVHDDGSVHYVSRNRTEEIEAGGRQNQLANQTPLDIDNSKLNLASLQNVKSYQIEKCPACGCLKGLKGQELEDILYNKNPSFPTQQHNMVQMVDGKPYIKRELNKFKIDKNETCIFSPPVPHSCNYDPEGDSKVDEKEQEVRENLYCTLYNEISGNGDKYKVVENIVDIDKAIQEYDQSCGQKRFPASEQDCLKTAKDAGGSPPQVSTSVRQN